MDATREESPTQPAQIFPAGDTGKLAFVYQTQLIIGSALCEGMAFFAAIAYMLERNPLALGMALILLACLAVRIPTRDRVNAWIDQQQSMLQIGAASRLLTRAAHSSTCLPGRKQ